ncbi:MAG: hypothetical protein RL095_886 [Verrucomicrobiota bacterium]|jgi:predicted regulator of Ras-like GTPase activity (Roadblock/LC7/MglB family)
MMAYELTQRDCDILTAELLSLLDLSEASVAILCDRGGSVLVKEGEGFDDEQELLAALVAGSYAATRELAGVVGERDFDSIVHQGKGKGLLMHAIGTDVVLLVVFNQEASPGLVKMYADRSSRNLEALFDEISRRDAVVARDVTATFQTHKP